MRRLDDDTQLMDEKNEARMKFRTKPRIKRAIQQAAALAGVDVSMFTMTDAHRAVLAIPAAHERTLLSPADCEAFFAVLDQAAKPVASLRDAFRRHAETVVSR